MIAPSRIRSANGKLRNRNDEAGAPVSDKLQLLHDFVFQVPGKNDDVVRLSLSDSVGMINRDVTAGQESTLLVWAAIYSVFDQIFADTAVIQQSGTLAWRAVTRDRLALALCCQKEFHQRIFRLFHLRAKTFISTQCIEPSPLLFGDQLPNPCVGLPAFFCRPARVDAERTTVGGQFIDADHLKSVNFHHWRRREQRELGEVLVLIGA